ncbi:hypothetical protein chiPu_0015742 [Chiloscyllium punctatum]|uniref:Uncharacterized protein n=1 Tax=Chiloscyllium punctatum TaxID=137246 RepID=A0A401T3Q0_CHIPU|nr:hypothetical protein [Chiloscyllium punctatum]
MHKNKKAWFSESVSRHICDLWEIRAAVGNFIWELDNPLQPQQSHERGDASKRKRSANCHHPEMERIDQDIHNNGRRFVSSV